MIRIASHNNNYHKFKSLGSSYAVITVMGSPYVLRPNKDKEYVFNTLDVSSSLFDYSDTFDYDNDLIDLNQSKSVLFNIQTFKTSLNTSVPDSLIETQSFSCVFFNGAFQRWECPFVDDGVVNLSNIQMPYFVGYPFEYSEVIDNDIKRVLVDDGTGTSNNNNVRNIITECAGVYLKWHNTQWGYCYYLFDKITKEKMNMKSIGRLSEHFAWTSNYLELGKSGHRELKIHAVVDLKDEEIMKSLIKSNEVYLFTGTKGEKATASNWLEVQINGGFKNTSKRSKFQQYINIKLPQEQTRKRI